MLFTSSPGDRKLGHCHNRGPYGVGCEEGKAHVRDRWRKDRPEDTCRHVAEERRMGPLEDSLCHRVEAGSRRVVAEDPSREVESEVGKGLERGDHTRSSREEVVIYGGNHRDEGCNHRTHGEDPCGHSSHLVGDRRSRDEEEVNVNGSGHERVVDRVALLIVGRKCTAQALP